MLDTCARDVGRIARHDDTWAMEMLQHWKPHHDCTVWMLCACMSRRSHTTTAAQTSLTLCVMASVAREGSQAQY